MWQFERHYVTAHKVNACVRFIQNIVSNWNRVSVSSWLFNQNSNWIIFICKLQIIGGCHSNKCFEPLTIICYFDKSNKTRTHECCERNFHNEKPQSNRHNGNAFWQRHRQYNNSQKKAEGEKGEEEEEEEEKENEVWLKALTSTANTNSNSQISSLFFDPVLRCGQVRTHAQNKPQFPKF